MGKKKRSSSGKTQDVKAGNSKSWLTSQVEPPEPLSFHEPGSWPAWIKRYKIYHSAVGLASASQDQQVNMLLYCMGSEADELLTSLGVMEEKRTSFNHIVATFEDYFTIKKNKLYHRVLFLRRNQKPEEKYDSYIKELSELSEKCDWSCENCKDKRFGNEIMLVKLIASISDDGLSKRLLRQQIATLTECVDILRASEIEKNEKKIVSGDLISLSYGKQKTEKPGIQREEHRGSVITNNTKDDPVSSTTPSALNEEYESPLYFSPKYIRQEDKGNMRCSFSSGVETGDEYELAGNSYFYASGETSDKYHNVFERKDSSASSSSNGQQFTKQYNGRGAGIQKCGGKLTAVKFGYFDDSDEEDGCKKNLHGLSPKNRSLFTSNKICISANVTSKLDNSSWPELGKNIPKKKQNPTPDSMQLSPCNFYFTDYDFDSDEEDAYLDYLDSLHGYGSKKAYWELYNSTSELGNPIPKVNDNPKPFENFHFSVSGHQSKKALRKMCQQRLKSFY